MAVVLGRRTLVPQLAMDIGVVGKTDQSKGPNNQQGSLHYTPEHCLVNGGVPLFWPEKVTCFNWAKCT